MTRSQGGASSPEPKPAWVCRWSTRASRVCSPLRVEHEHGSAPWGQDSTSGPWARSPRPTVPLVSTRTTPTRRSRMRGVSFAGREGCRMQADVLLDIDDIDGTTGEFFDFLSVLAESGTDALRTGPRREYRPLLRAGGLLGLRLRRARQRPADLQVPLGRRRAGRRRKRGQRSRHGAAARSTTTRSRTRRTRR